MGRFSASLQCVRKIKNHAAARPAKIEIRRNILDEVGRQAHVFDGFAGTGEMHKAVWHEAAGYVGCDLERAHDGRTAFVADNRRVLRAIDLARFGIFDLDAFGSPWEQVLIVAARRKVAPGETIGLVLTEGSGLKLKQGDMPLALAELAGMRGRPAGVARWQDALTERALNGLMRKMQCSIVRRWQANGKTGAGVRYIGLVLKGQDASASS